MSGFPKLISINKPLLGKISLIHQYILKVPLLFIDLPFWSTLFVYVLAMGFNITTLVVIRTLYSLKPLNLILEILILI